MFAAFGCAGFGTARAAWIENFDSYPVGNIDGNGPWVDWGGSLTPDVSTAQSLSGANSLRLSSNPDPGAGDAYGTDVYATTLDPGGVVSSGVWDLTYQLYVEPGFTGQAEMYVSQFAMDGTAASFSDGLWIRTTTSGTIDLIGATATANPAVVYGAWTPVQLIIDLDADSVTATYGGNEFYSGVWDIATSGTPGLGGVNFWSDGPTGSAGSFFVDDFSLQPVPEPALGGLLALGSLALIRSRRRRV